MNHPALKKILCVEDELDIQLIIKMSLEANKLIVETCSSGNEALQKAPLFSPDLILLDMMMPGMDGIATMKELRKNPSLSQVPIIFMTAKVQKKEIDQYKQLGAIEVITKPFDPITLPSLLEEIWKKFLKKLFMKSL